MMKTLKYIKAGDKFLALNLKAASSSLLSAIATTFYPEVVDTLENNTTYPDGMTPSNMRLHAVLDKTDSPNGETVLVVRDPVDRFRSACAENRIENINELLTKIESGESRNAHFWLTSRLLLDGIKLYRFDSDLDDVATALGLPLPLPNITGDNPPKPDLTADQLVRVQAIYADDITLYESITEAGQVYISPPTPATDEDKATKRQEIATARYESEVAGLVLNGIPIATDRHTQSVIGNAFVIADKNTDYTVDWLLESGDFITLDAPTIISIGYAVAAHVQTQYTKQKELYAEINNATTLEELNRIIW